MFQVDKKVIILLILIQAKSNELYI